MENVRVIEMPPCKMVSSGAGLFGEPEFERFGTWLGKQPRGIYSLDFLCEARVPGMFKFEWLYLYEQGMDTENFAVVDFPGGLYAVVTGVDGQSNEAEMTAVKEFIAKSGFTVDETRPSMGNIIATPHAKDGLGYDQMDYFTPIKLKNA